MLVSAVEQLCVYVYPLPLSLSPIPPSLFSVITEHPAELLVHTAASHELSVLHVVVYVLTYMFSQFVPPSPSRQAGWRFTEKLKEHRVPVQPTPRFP